MLLRAALQEGTDSREIIHFLAWIIVEELGFVLCYQASLVLGN